MTPKWNKDAMVLEQRTKRGGGMRNQVGCLKQETLRHGEQANHSDGWSCPRRDEGCQADETGRNFKNDCNCRFLNECHDFLKYLGSRVFLNKTTSITTKIAHNLTGKGKGNGGKGEHGAKGGSESTEAGRGAGGKRGGREGPGGAQHGAGGSHVQAMTDPEKRKRKKE